MPARSCFSHSCKLNSMKYLSEEWNLLQETRKILGYFQDTTYNHRCLANSFLLLQSLYSLKMALSIFFCLCSLHVCSVSFEEKKEKRNCTVHSGTGTTAFWSIYHKSSAETGCNADIPDIVSLESCYWTTSFPRGWMASTLLKAQKVNTFSKGQLQLFHILIFKDPG